MDWNWLLIDFFDPKLSPDSIKIVAMICIRTQILNPNLIFIENWSNLIEIGQKWMVFVVFVIVFNINWLLQSFNQLFPSFNWNFQSFYQSFNQISSNLDRKKSILYRNCNRWYGFVVGFRIGPKSTNQIWISDLIWGRWCDSQSLITLAYFHPV